MSLHFSHLSFSGIRRLLQPNHLLYTQGKQLEESAISVTVREKPKLFPELHIRLPLLFHQLELYHMPSTNWKLARKKLEMVTWLTTQKYLPPSLNQTNCVSSLCKHGTRCLSSHSINKQSLVERFLCA